MISKFAVTSTSVGAALADSRNLRSSFVHMDPVVLAEEEPSLLQMNPHSTSISPDAYVKFLKSDRFQVCEISDAEFHGEAWTALARDEVSNPMIAAADLVGMDPALLQRLKTSKATVKDGTYPGDKGSAEANFEEDVKSLKDLGLAYPRAANFPEDIEEGRMTLETVPLTEKHKQAMKGHFERWVDTWIETLASDSDDWLQPLALPNKKQSKFWMGGQPFWAINPDGSHSHIVGYEILFRHAAVRKDKMHNTPVKTFFNGRENANALKIFGHGAPIQVMDLEGKVDSLQTDLVKAGDCRLVTVQIAWAKRALLRLQGQIKFISINVRPDEWLMQCKDKHNTGEFLKDILLREALDVRRRVGSDIVYEITEYAPIDEQVRAVLRELRAQGVIIWADDVSPIDPVGQRQAPQGMKPAGHSTDMATVKGLLDDNLVSGHKLASDVCIQMNGKILERFPATSAEAKAFHPEKLERQFGPVGFVAELSEMDFAHVKDKTAEYMQHALTEHRNAVFVIENSAGVEQFGKFHSAIDIETNYEQTLVQGGASADLALDMHDLLNLHTADLSPQELAKDRVFTAAGVHLLMKFMLHTALLQPKAGQNVEFSHLAEMKRIGADVRVVLAQTSEPSL